MFTRNPSLQTHDIIVYRIPNFLRVPLTGNNIYSLLTIKSKEQQERFSTLLRLITNAGLKEQLSSGECFHILASFTIHSK